MNLHLATGDDSDSQLVAFLLTNPILVQDLTDTHTPDREPGGPVTACCKACPGRPVWPCTLRQSADRATGILGLQAKAQEGLARLAFGHDDQADDRDQHDKPRST